jgi:hypothetical protein
MDDATLRGSFTLDSQPPLLIGGGSNLETSVSPSTLFASAGLSAQKSRTLRYQNKICLIHGIPSELGSAAFMQRDIFLAFIYASDTPNRSSITAFCQDRKDRIRLKNPSLNCNWKVDGGEVFTPLIADRSTAATLLSLEGNQ